MGNKAEIKGLTLYAAWSWAIIHVGKRVENRMWEQRSIIGNYIAIHAGRNIGQKHGDNSMFYEMARVGTMATYAGSAKMHVNKQARILAIQEGVGNEAVIHTGCEASNLATVQGYFKDDARIIVTPMYTSAFVGIARVADITRPHESGWYAGDRAGENDGKPCFAYVLDNVIRFRSPIPYARGERRFWTISEPVLKRSLEATVKGIRLR